MPTPPRRSEKQDAFISRCMSTLHDEGTPKKQALAICFSMWRKKHGGKKPSKSEEITLSDNAVFQALINLADKHTN